MRPRDIFSSNMAGIERFGEFVVCVSGPNVVVYKIGSSERQICKSEKPKESPQKDDASGETHQEKEGGDQETGGTDCILAAGFSPSGDHYATCDDNKNLTLWKTGETWTQISVRSLTRRCTSLCFSQSGSFLVVGDKSGDVYSFSVSNPEEHGVLKLGHVSMLLDVCLCGRDEDFVATADRDEKVRVSCFPNSYNIQSFCLGHEEFVSRLLYLRDEDILISGSGDGTVRLWDYSVGKQLHCEACHSTLNPEGQGSDLSQSQGIKDTQNADVTRLSFYSKEKILAVGFDRCKSILLYKLVSESGKHSLELHQKLDLEVNVWDMTFDTRGDLWIVQRQEGGAVVYRGKSDGCKKFAPLAEPDDDPVISTLSVINKDWDILKESLCSESYFSNFQKSKMDSAHFYFEKKQKRLEDTTKRKSAALQTPGVVDKNQDTSEKKTKLETEKSS